MATGAQVAWMWMAVGHAYAGRGETSRAQNMFEQAKKILETNDASAPAEEIRRWLSIFMSALRGDVEAIRTALAQLGPQPTDYNTGIFRTRGYQQLVVSLLKANQLAFAMEVATSAPQPFRDYMLSRINAEHAANGRIDDARAVMALFSDKMSPQLRRTAVRDVAVAMAKGGQPSVALELVARQTDVASRKAVLFAIAQALPQ